MRFALAIALILVVGVANAWTFHGDVQRTGNFSKVNGSDLIWKTKIGGLIDSSPVVKDGRVYVLSWYGSFYNETSKLSCFYAKNGTEIWNASIEGASTPTVYDNLIVVGDLSGKLHCFDTNGRELWNVTLETNPSWWGIASSPLIYNNTIYITTFSNGTLWALDLNGNVKWRITTGGEISYYTSPSAYDHLILFAGNYSGTNELVCVNESGFVLWNFTVDSKILSSIAIAYGNAYFTTQHRIYAVNLTTHKEIWNKTINGTISTPAIAYGKVFVGSRDGILYCLNAFNGNEIWHFKANGKIDSSPAVGGNIVYFATNTAQGTIYALNITDGSLIWKYTLIPPQGRYYNVMSSPFIWNGKLFIGADDGNLYCFGNFSTIWSGTVTLIPENVTITLKDGNQTQINGASALYALIKAGQGNFSVNVTKTSWGLYVESIAGINPEGYCGWMYWVNYPNEPIPSVGADRYVLKDNDTVLWYYGCYDPNTWKPSTPADSNYVVKIRVKVKPIVINGLSVSNARLGGNVTAYVNVTSYSNGWFVLVVSGVNDEGDYVAGISTFYLSKGQSLRVPVLLHVPQRNTAGTYKLIAGIYRLEDYPNELLSYSKEVECEVSR